MFLSLFFLPDMLLLFILMQILLRGRWGAGVGGALGKHSGILFSGAELRVLPEPECAACRAAETALSCRESSTDWGSLAETRRGDGGGRG